MTDHPQCFFFFFYLSQDLSCIENGRRLLSLGGILLFGWELVLVSGIWDGSRNILAFGTDLFLSSFSLLHSSSLSSLRRGFLLDSLGWFCLLFFF